MMGSGSSNLRACRFQLFDGKLQKTFVDESGIERILNNVKPAHTRCAISTDEGASIESDL